MRRIVKNMAITFFCIILFLFGWVFLHSRYHSTGLGDELQVQITRLFVADRYKREVNFAKFILKTIAENEEPPEIWQTIVQPTLNRFSNDSFYFFKIWLIESKTTLQDIENSYPIYIFEKDNKILFELRCGRSNPTIQFTIIREQESKLKSDFIFPLNNCLFDPDYNKDDKYDRKDVLLAKEKLVKNDI